MQKVEKLFLKKKFFLMYYCPHLALHYATSCNHPTFMELLVRDFNCPSNTVDSRGRTALFYAIKGDLSDAIKVLLKHGADASWQDGDGNR